MKIFQTKSLLLSAALLVSPLALAQTQGARSDEAQNTISVQFRGSLRDALQEIAEEGQLNVVLIGQLDTPAEVYLKDVGARQALRTVARAYSLRLEEEGGIFTVRAPAGGAMPQGSAAVAPAPPVPSFPSMPPPPPAPPPPDMAHEVAESALDEDEVKERVRERVQEVRRSSRGSRDVVARGRSLEVTEGETVDSAVVYGGNLAVKGHVEDDAVVFGGNLEITGHVEGDAHAFGGNVVLGPGAVVEGDVSSFGGSVIKENGAKVEGSTESFGGANIGALVAGELRDSLKKEMKEHVREEVQVRRDDRDGMGFAGFLIRFAVLFGLGFLGQMIFPARMKQMAAEIQAQPLKAGMVGLLGTFVMLLLSPFLFVLLLIATVILAVTIIGIPVAVALWLLLPLPAVLGFTAVASAIGLKVPVLRGRKTQAMVLALGLLLLLVLGQIPVLGGLLLVAATVMGFGAVLLTWLFNRPRGMPEPIISEHASV